MVDYLTSNTMLMLEKAMDFQWTKQNALLDNIANAETPNYKTKYVTFEEALRAQIRTAAGGSQPTAAIRDALHQAAPVVHTADDETMRMDGNGVNVAEQQIEMVRNAYQLQYVMDAINSDMTLLLTAIRGQ